MGLGRGPGRHWETLVSPASQSGLAGEAHGDTTEQASQAAPEEAAMGPGRRRCGPAPRHPP